MRNRWAAAFWLSHRAPRRCFGTVPGTVAPPWPLERRAAPARPLFCVPGEPGASWAVERRCRDSGGMTSMCRRARGSVQQWASVMCSMCRSQLDARGGGRLARRCSLQQSPVCSRARCSPCSLLGAVGSTYGACSRGQPMQRAGGASRCAAARGAAVAGCARTLLHMGSHLTCSSLAPLPMSAGVVWRWGRSSRPPWVACTAMARARAARPRPTSGARPRGSRSQPERCGSKCVSADIGSNAGCIEESRGVVGT